jgi:hypothetical protein
MKFHALFVLLILLASPLAAPAVPLTPQKDAICIDVGRQLLVDDYLIDQTTLRRSFHTPRLYDKNPVLEPETLLEMNRGRLPVAAPFDDGVFYDSHDHQFKMWYQGGCFDGNCYAVSKDGLSWQRPSLDVVPGTNRVLPIREGDGNILQRDATTVWLDSDAVDPLQRFKMFVYSRERGQKSDAGARGEVFTSSDGIHWSGPVKVGFPHGDNSSFFYDPFRRHWVYSVRNTATSLRHPHDKKMGVRARFYLADADFLHGACAKDTPILWLRADASDQPDPDLGYEPQLYDFTAVAYESLMLGVYGIFIGPPNEVCLKEHRPKIIDLKLGYSRDGVHFDRPDHQAFIASARTPGVWNRAYLHPATGVCLVVGDNLYFYFGAWSGISPKIGDHVYAGGSTGLAVLRRDGFASMDAGLASATLTTKLLTFRGKYPFVNAVAKEGELRMEVLDADGKTIAPFSLDNCTPIRGDSTRQRLTWKRRADLSTLAGKPVRFKFQLTHGKLYAFWVSPDVSGASYGYVAAGGPGLTGSRDTTGCGL